MSNPFPGNVLPFRTALVPKSSDVAWTAFDRRFNSWHKAGEVIPRTGPVRTTPIPFRLIANAPAIILASMDPNRVGAMIQNKDATDILYVGFGTLADINGFEVAPRQTVLLDFICPTDSISVFSTVALSGYLALFAKQAE